MVLFKVSLKCFFIFCWNYSKLLNLFLLLFFCFLIIFFIVSIKIFKKLSTAWTFDTKFFFHYPFSGRLIFNVLTPFYLTFSNTFYKLFYCYTCKQRLVQAVKVDLRQTMLLYMKFLRFSLLNFGNGNGKVFLLTA